MVEAYIAVGSNIGEREANIKKAFELLKEKTRFVTKSELYETKPMYMENQSWFLNGVAKIKTELTLRELLAFLKSIEQKLGRETVARNGPRIIDLDILFYGTQIVNEKDLQIPHPKMIERAFVLVPLAEIAPNFIHPIYKKTITQLLTELNYDKSEIKAQNNRKPSWVNYGMKVKVKTPARLHLGLIDLSGDLGRMFGGIGVAIDHPNVILEVEKSQTLTFSGKKMELTRKLAANFLEASGLKEKVSIFVEQTIPEHVGLGSGTQLALAVASAISKLSGLKASTDELATVMGRVAQSGVGTAVFEQGGLVVDGGKNTKDSSKKSIPLICRLPFPDEWRFVVVIPQTKKGLSNEAEASAFKQLPPMAPEDVGKICRLTMLKLLPSVVEKDIKSFGEALTQIQSIVGDSFSQAQGGRYSSSPSAKSIEFMLENGAYGSGQSSWGPTVYGIVRSVEAKELQIKTQAFLNSSVGGDVFVAKASNRGAIIKVFK